MPIIHRKFIRWHVWLGWLVGVPLILWTLSGLVMVARPIEEVRGTHLRIERPETMLATEELMPLADMSMTISDARLQMADGKPVWLVTFQGGRQGRIDARSGTEIPAVDEAEARSLAASQIKDGDKVIAAILFENGESVGDFRRPIPVWQVALEDGTHVYIGRDTGQIEAVRTRFWRVFDFMWGLHIMDLQTREDTSHPTLILFAALALFGSILGFAMLFTRGKPIGKRR